MHKKDLLIEIGCEELPPKDLSLLGKSLHDGLVKGLTDARLIGDDARSRWLASPRRLAVRINNVAKSQEDRDERRLGPAVAAAFDGEGKPTRAAEGFARSCGVTVEELERIATDKGERLGVTMRIPGEPAGPLVILALEKAMKGLPVPKPMRWGDNDFAFVRPVHWIVALHGKDVIEGSLYGCKLGRMSRGHRFLSEGAVWISNAQEYEDALRGAHVIVDPLQRARRIRDQAHELATEAGARAVLRDDLVEEVASLVEWPVGLIGSFDDEFLSVPAEALISSMEGHQKCFPLIDADGNLLPRFIAIANIDSREPERVREGFERVIRPRLADARFFWDTDRKVPLAAHADALQKMVYQKRLGTLADKSSRVAGLAAGIAAELGLDPSPVRRAAELAKCDLLTQMVGEFPELQGTMGRYYALASGEDEAVAIAIEEQYLPRFAADRLPETDSGRILAAAERLDTLAGIFAVGMKPSGNKDPYALRRAALGLARLTIEGGLDIDLERWLGNAVDRLPHDVRRDGPEVDETLAFCFDRLQGYYADRGIPREVFAAVRAVRPTAPVDFDRRVAACTAFARLPEAEALAAANKRIGNILAKAPESDLAEFDPALVTDDAERKLAADVEAAVTATGPLLTDRQYEAALLRLAQLRDNVDRFFDEVLVMADDDAVRRNRLALLGRLKAQFDAIADIAELARAS